MTVRGPGDAESAQEQAGDRTLSFAPADREGRYAAGEPDWMPSPQEVARAKARLERRGIGRALSAGALLRPPTPSVAPDVPWFWWGGALAWVLLWPALIAAKLGYDRPAWLPWWLPPTLALGHLLALALPVLLSERARSRNALRRRFGHVRTLAQILALEPEQFEAWTAILFRLMGYQVRGSGHAADHGIDLYVANDLLPLGLVQCKRYRGVVGEPLVRDLYGTMIHETAAQGWLVTTGAISRQAREWANGKPIELWDGQNLVALARRYR